MTVEAGCDIPLHLKENITIDFVVTGDSDEVVDLTQAEKVVFKAAHLHRTGEPVIQKEILDGSTDGEITVELGKQDTEQLRTGNYEYEVYVEFPDEEEFIANQAVLFIKKRTGVNQ